MPRINIYEHSDTYSFQVTNRAYACIAFPITAIWGPVYNAADDDLNPDWLRFEAGFRGTTDFVNTFRGPNTALGAREKSYDYALKLLASGYDVLVKRADGLGSNASRDLVFNYAGSTAIAGASAIVTPVNPDTMPTIGFTATAKNPGVFGNRIKVWVEPKNYIPDSSVQKPTGEEGSWAITKEFTQQLTIRVYLAGSEQANKTDLSCMTIQPTDTLLESHNVSVVYPTTAGSINAQQQVPIGNSGYLSSVTVALSYANRYETRTSWIITLGKTVAASAATNQWSQTSTGVGGGDSTFGAFNIPAKYPGTYGNQLKVRIKVGTDNYGRKIGTVEVFDRNGYTDSPDAVVRTDQLLEMRSVAFDVNAATDSQPYITETVFSNLGVITVQNSNLLTGSTYVTSLLGGTDYATVGNGISTTPDIDVQIMNIVLQRMSSDTGFAKYIRAQVGDTAASVAPEATMDEIVQIWNQQSVMQNAIAMLGELTDPLAYDWDAVFMGIMDDQYIPLSWQEAHPEVAISYEPTAAHLKMLEAAANSKCGAALIGTPFGLKRGTIMGDIATGTIKFKDDLAAAAGQTLSTFGELVGPWCKTTLPINGANSWITPELGHLLLIINAQGVGGQNKWWMVPAGMTGSGIVHSPEYRVKKAYLDIIQDHNEGVCMNPLMQVPGKGFTCFGNSTLWDKPLGTYNALQNLSTRFLTNRVKQRIWDTALQILFKYNNQNAYSHFYAGVSPLLDEMRAVGALTGTESNPWGYRIIMNPDIINLDRINANTVIGKVELAVTGVIDTVDVDLFLLPPTAFQDV